MAQTNYTPISLYYSTTAAAIPSNANLVPGELALNIEDMKLYCENAAGTVTLLASSAGSAGNVVGPASATDKAIVTFDGTTGKLIQNNSGNTIGTTGNTVIEVTDNTNAALRITQLGTGNALLVEDSTNPDATPFVVDATGRLGIGNSSPGQPLDITSVDFGARIARFNTSNIAPGIDFRKSASATVGTNTLVANGDNLGRVLFSGADGTNFTAAAEIQASVDGTPGLNDMPGRLVFATTADGASSTTERMRIDSAGNVGMGGTAAAANKVQITSTLPTSATNSRGLYINGIIPSGTTGNASIFQSEVSTAAASFTLSSLRHFWVFQGSLGAGSAITNQYGFVVESNLTSATNNYGFYGDIASGANRFNLYMNGTAENYLAGNLKIGGTAARGTTAGTNHLSLFNGTAPAGTLTNGVSMYSASGDLSFIDATGGAYKVGYRNIPAVGTKTSSYTLAVGDVGKYVQVSTGGSIVIPDATFAEGDAINIFNNTSGAITITCTITTAYIAGTDADKATITLATRGLAIILFISGNVCVVSGNVI
jgi:hypothetical protein